MLRGRIRLVTKIALVGPLVGSMIIRENFLADHVTGADVDARVQRQMALGTERFVAQGTNVNFVLLRCVLGSRETIKYVTACLSDVRSTELLS